MGYLIIGQDSRGIKDEQWISNFMRALSSMPFIGAHQLMYCDSSHSDGDENCYLRAGWRYLSGLTTPQDHLLNEKGDIPSVEAIADLLSSKEYKHDSLIVFCQNPWQYAVPFLQKIGVRLQGNRQIKPEEVIVIEPEEQLYQRVNVKERHKNPLVPI